MKIRSAVVSVLAAGALLSSGSAVADETDNPSPWHPYETADFTVPAGQMCDFTLGGEVVQDKERYRTTEYFPDGSPRYQEFTGELVIDYTNEDTGETVRRNLTGRGDFEYFADGSWELTAVGGHLGLGMRPGDEPVEGFLVVTGAGHSLHEDATGHRTFTAGSGTVENICDTLG